jgi:tRNA dimethylallyltransferase
MQVYKGMDVITQAPAKAVLARAPHHLLKFLAPSEEYSAARYAEDAEKVIEDVISRGRVPVFAGGTGLYVKTLVDGIFEAPSKDEGLRRRLEEEAREKGAEYLHARLAQRDPQTAAKLHPNDLRRVIRALEVLELTGRTIHEKKKEREGISGEYDIRMFGLDVPREELYACIDKKVDEMFAAGLVGEVEHLIGGDLAATARQALGVKEVSAHLEGAMTLAEATEELKKNTRRYAKRQLTWFRADGRIVWVDAARSAEEIVREIENQIK